MSDKTYDDRDRGALWPRKPRDDDEPGKRYPALTGTVNVDGVEYFVDAWKRPSDASPESPVLTFKIKRKTKQPAPKPQRDALDDLLDGDGP